MGENEESPREFSAQRTVVKLHHPLKFPSNTRENTALQQANFFADAIQYVRKSALKIV